MNNELDPMVLRLISYGLYVVASKHGNKMNGQIVNTVFQVTAQPPRIAVSINKENLTHRYIMNSRIFSVSILDEATPLNFIGLFGFKSGRKVDKLHNIKHIKGIGDCPVVIENSLGFLEAEVIDQVDVGTHTLFIGEVKRGKVLRKGAPLTYTHYHLVKRGKVPQRAPTYIAAEPKTAPTYIEPTKPPISSAPTSPKLQKYQCEVCGWIYDPTLGDPEHDIVPGTSFEDLPDDWVCPLCGAEKSQFKPI